MITPLCKKSTQAINYFAHKKDGKINKMKAIKLIYFADRYHLRKYGRPVVGDTYWAMKLGPVASNVLDTANFDEGKLDRDCLDYAKSFLGHPADDAKLLTVTSKKDVELKVFSQSDIEALEAAYNEFGDKDQFELADIISHSYPEWAKHKEEIEGGKKRVRMDYADFFLNSRHAKSSGIFELSEEHLALTKNIYLENQEAEFLLEK
jgi:hypothetical protein